MDMSTGQAIGLIRAFTGISRLVSFRMTGAVMASGEKLGFAPPTYVPSDPDRLKIQVQISDLNEIATYIQNYTFHFHDQSDPIKTRLANGRRSIFNALLIIR